MNKEDIDRAVADLVEAIRIDAAIEMAKSDHDFLARQADDAHEEYDRSIGRSEESLERLLELQRHKRDVAALKERLSSLLAENNATIDRVQVDTVTVSPEDRLRYVHELEKSCLAPCGYKVQPEFMADAVAGKHDGSVAAWMAAGGNISTK